MSKCKIIGCSSKYSRGCNITFFKYVFLMNLEIDLVQSVMKNCSVPLNQPERSKWIEAIEKVQPFDNIVATYKLCEFHFLPEDIDTRGKRKHILPGRVPSVFSNKKNDPNNVEYFSMKTSLCYATTNEG